MTTAQKKIFDDLKAKHPDTLLLFRCGDFYETYQQDADTVANVLGLTLTRTLEDGVLMAGFPHHALDSYLPRLIRAGHRCAICDQLGTSRENVTTVKRGISELIADKSQRRCQSNARSSCRASAPSSTNSSASASATGLLTTNVSVNTPQAKVSSRHGTKTLRHNLTN